MSQISMGGYHKLAQKHAAEGHIEIPSSPTTTALLNFCNLIKVKNLSFRIIQNAHYLKEPNQHAQKLDLYLTPLSKINI